MPRNMSFSATTQQVRDRTKTVTRRCGWGFLKPGDRLWAVEQAIPPAYTRFIGEGLFLIAKRTGHAERTVQRALQRMRLLRMIELREPAKGRGRAAVYLLIEKGGGGVTVSGTERVTLSDTKGRPAATRKDGGGVGPLDRQLAETGTVRSCYEVQNQMINTARSGGFRPGHVEIQDA